MQSSLVLAVIIAIVGGSLPAHQLKAQPFACDTACPSVPYSPTVRTVVYLNNGCPVRVSWRLRVGCGGMIDVAIEAVQPLETTCTGIRLQDLLWQSVDALFRQRRQPTPFPAWRPDTCLNIYRVVTVVCWGLHDRCGDTIALPCDSSACCVTRYTLCADSSGNRLPRRGPSSQLRLCDSANNCTPVCPGGAQGKYPVQERTKEEESGGSLSVNASAPDNAGTRPAVSPPAETQWAWSDDD